MQTYGPLTLNANTITSVGVPPSSAFVYVGNDSPYDVLVAFTPYKPAVVTQATGDWSGVVQAMHHGNFPTPANIQSPLGGGFAGKVWLLPLDTRSSSLASTGGTSSLANAWVIATAPGEQPPDAYAAPRQTDLSSQPRVLSVPLASENVATGTLTVAVGSTVINTDSVDNNRGAMAYLYYAQCMPSQYTGAGSPGQATVQIEVDLLRNGVSMGAPYPIRMAYAFVMWQVAGTTQPWEFRPPHAVAVPLGVPGDGATYQAEYHMRIVNLSGSNTGGLIYIVSVSTDSNNGTQFPGMIGQSSDAIAGRF